MLVLKFGGTSVGSSDNIKKVGNIIQGAASQHNRLIVVVSAMNKMTDQLIQLYTLAAKNDEKYTDILTQKKEGVVRTIQELGIGEKSVTSIIDNYFQELSNLLKGIFLLKHAAEKTQDQVMSYGELISSQIITHYLNTLRVDTMWLDSRALIKTDSTYNNAQVNGKITYRNIREYIQKQKVNVLLAPGFIASNEKNITTTIGRGGSDYSAVLYAVAAEAKALEIWTDVGGIMTANPRIVPHARIIENIPYAAALELSHFGAKVVFAHTFEPAMKRQIPIIIKNTFDPKSVGTKITHSISSSPNTYTGVSAIDEVGLLSIQGGGALQFTNVARRVFDTFYAHQIPVLLTTQGSSDNYICIAVAEKYLAKAELAMTKEFGEDTAASVKKQINIEKELAVISLIGENMKNHQGIAGRMLTALGKNGINIRAIAQGASERNISVVINRKDIKKATLVLHEDFFEENYKQLHVFIAGVGNVGGKLVEQIQQQQHFLKEHTGLKLKVIGLANSKNMLFNATGIALNSWKEQLQKAQPRKSAASYAQQIINTNLRNSVFVDITSNDKVAATYDSLLEKSISVVACNKVACSREYAYYSRLKKLSKDYKASLMFETNVGAGLPVIDTLANLVKSGDKIERIEAVLSGTLNLVFNLYDGKKSFASIVKYAQNKGYTEPDPRLDLSGLDVARKILILAREAGHKMNLEDVNINSFIPEEIMNGSIDHFYHELEKHEETFLQLYQNAKKEKCILKHVASFKDGHAEIGLKHITEKNDLYYLQDKDNIVLFYTKHYGKQPMVIKGAGAGADITASGVFADILKTRY